MKELFDKVSADCSRNVTKTYSTSFSLATRMLSKNIREDIYGGSIEKRSNFVKEIVEAIRSRVTNNFIVGLRFSQ